jgi:hypothetical protein
MEKYLDPVELALRFRTCRLCIRLRIADADRYRADVHISVVDVPAILSVIFGSAAGEGGHAPMIPPIWPDVKPLGVGVHFWGYTR